MSHQKTQGLIFSIFVGLLLVMTSLLPSLQKTPSLPVMAVLILLFGVPHGAFDVLYGRESLKLDKPIKWLIFISFYLLATIFVAVLWLIAPLFFLLGFLAISIFHFSGDPSPGTPLITRLLYGAAIIILPTFSNQVEVARLFAYLVDETTARMIANVLHELSSFWLIALMAAAGMRCRQNWVSGLEIFSVALLAIFTPPLLAFTIFFCCMHSARHILRTLEYFKQYPKAVILGAALLPMILIALPLAIALYLRMDLATDTTISQLVFVGLAALTVPHMALIEPIRIRLWKKPISL